MNGNVREFAAFDMLRTGFDTFQETVLTLRVLFLT
jgi:hypothetical protein